jgi:hypothetical protein
MGDRSTRVRRIDSPVGRCQRLDMLWWRRKVRNAGNNELRTTTPPPGRDYLPQGVLWSEAVVMCLDVANQQPEMAPRYLKWLADEARMAVLGEGPMHGPQQGWTRAGPR